MAYRRGLEVEEHSVQRIAQQPAAQEVLQFDGTVRVGISQHDGYSIGEHA